MTTTRATLLTVLLAARPMLAQAPAAAKPALPAAETVIEKYIEATGGMKAYSAAHNMISTGSFAMPAQGLKGTVKVYAAEPNNQYAVVEIPGVGTIEEGSNGEIAWEVSALTGARIKAGDEGAAALREGAVDAMSNWKKYYSSAVTDGVEDIEGKPCYRVIMTPKKGSDETTFFAKDSGLMLQRNAILDSPMGKVPVTVTVSDYRKVNDLLLPHKIVQNVMGQQIVMALDSTLLNADIPKDRFALPAAVKALQK